MINTEVFLDLYKQLEDELEKKYRGAKRRYSSVVFEYSKDPASAVFRDKLDVVREIRNLLTHNANIGGLPVIEPSEPVVEGLREVLAYVKNPPLALEYAKQGETIMRATLNQGVLCTMELMDKNGFSNVPVMRNGDFIGVFSKDTIFRYVMMSGKPIDSATTLEDLQRLLPVKEHPQNYAFLPRNATYAEAKAIFEKLTGKGKRVNVIFITENGGEQERLLGMLTPWDVMGAPD